MIELCDVQSCTGCGGCANACPKRCIVMQPSEEGFLYPHIDYDNCIECGSCQRKCPILTPVKQHPPQGIYAAYARDHAIRTTSSSGGMFQALAQAILNRGGIVFGAVYSDDMSVHHIGVETIDGIQPMKGSKYVQSEIGSSYRKVLAFLSAGKPVLFVGTPCQVAAMKALTPPHLVKDKLYLVDLLCHGVPSALLFKDYLSKIEKSEPSVDKRSFQFRTLDGWDCFSSIENGKKRTRLFPPLSLYGDLFMAGYIHRESCYRCLFAKDSRVGDLTIADFWGIDADPSYKHDISKGVSLVLINTDQGKKLFERIESNLVLMEANFDYAKKYNTQLQHPEIRPSFRDGIYHYVLSHSLRRTYMHYFLKRMIRRTVANILRSLRLYK